jgi:hypothetical protein
MRRLARIVIVTAALLMLPRTVPAQDKEVTGVVISIDGTDIIIDLGKKQGMADGDVLELWRPLKIKHPVTGKLIVDRFKIGAIKITQVRDVLSLARPSVALSRPVEAGDVVVLVGAPKIVTVTPPPTPTKPPPAGTPPPTVVEADPDLRAVGALFESLHGTSPEVRAKAYDDFIKANPKSRFAGVLQEEIIALRAASSAVVPSGAPGSSEKPILAYGVRSWRKIDETLENAPFVFAMETNGPISGAVMQIRGADEPAYTPIPFVPRGDGYWAVTIPANKVRGPTLSWFVETVTSDGKATAVIGTSAEPVITKVVTAPGQSTPLKHESIAAIWADYADYNRWLRNDWAFQTEGYFGMRFGDVGVRAVRSGFGVYRGKGGSIADLDERPNVVPRSVGLSYGYLEGEFGIDSFWSIIARGIVGLGNEEVKGGGQAFVRIGNDKKTNLMLGGEILGGIGLRGISQLQLEVFPKVPIIVRSEVTNQPAGERAPRLNLEGGRVTSSEAGDIGVRAIVQIGYRITPGFTIFVRGSYQGRTIIHAGPGFGGGASVSW